MDRPPTTPQLPLTPAAPALASQPAAVAVPPGAFDSTLVAAPGQGGGPDAGQANRLQGADVRTLLASLGVDGDPTSSSNTASGTGSTELTALDTAAASGTSTLLAAAPQTLPTAQLGQPIVAADFALPIAPAAGPDAVAREAIDAAQTAPLTPPSILALGNAAKGAPTRAELRPGASPSEAQASPVRSESQPEWASAEPRPAQPQNESQPTQPQNDLQPHRSSPRVDVPSQDSPSASPAPATPATSSGVAERAPRAATRAVADASNQSADNSPSAAGPRPVALDAGQPVPAAGSADAKGVTVVNDSSVSAAGTAPEPGPAHAAAASVANQAVLRRVASGEIQVPELGRIAVRAEGTSAAVNVDVSVERTETHAALHASAGALAADLRQADVPLGQLRLERTGSQAALSDSSTGHGAQAQAHANMHDSRRDSHSSAEPEDTDDTTPTLAAGRVRIVL